MRFKLILDGEFQMGSPCSEKEHTDREGLIHPVTISKSFYLGMYEVTVGQFKEFVEATKYATEAERSGKGSFRCCPDEKPDGWDQGCVWRKPGFEQDDSSPVVCVSWNDARAFYKWLSDKEKRTYRLPTEAEWEYACRAGEKTPFHFGDALRGEQANCDGDFPYGTKDPGTYLKRTTRVGSFAPNPWGIYDMHGNVFEWCGTWDDWVEEDGKCSYSAGPETDPQGPDNGIRKIKRGGGWHSSPSDCRSARRDSDYPTHPKNDTGFRVVRELKE